MAIRPQPPSVGGDVPEWLCLVSPALCVADDLAGDKADTARDVAGAGVAAAAGNATETVTDAFGEASQKLFSGVLGPIAEVGLTLVLAGAGAALVVWGVIALAGRSKTIRTAAGGAVGAAVGGPAGATIGASIG